MTTGTQLRDAFRAGGRVVVGAKITVSARVWSVYRWLDGVPMDEAESLHLENIAADVASFLRSLQAVRTPASAPRPESSNGFRGDRFDRYLAEARQLSRCWTRH